MAPATLYMCEEVVREILSWLPVKSLLRFKCVSKWFQTLISDPSFVKLHLQRSPKRVEFLLMYLDDVQNRSFILPCPVASLLDDPLSFIADNLSLGFELKDMYEVVGTCNGLICFIGERNDGEECMFQVWNPSTRKTFEDMQCVISLPQSDDDLVCISAFGYDNLRDTYKVISILSTVDFNDGSLKSCHVNVCSMSDNNNCWRKIHSFPADPTKIQDRGVYLNNTVNWITLNQYHDYYDDSDTVTLDELVIVSLDLGTETYTRLFLPRALYGLQMHNVDQSVGVLNDCLSLFLHNHSTKRYSIWQMKEFGDQKSWTLSLSIPIQVLLSNSTPCLDLVPLIMFQNQGGVLMIDHSTYQRLRAIIYDATDNTLEHSRVSSNIRWIYAMDYVQSLVSL